ncbi:hypothetical protein INT47_004073, partial [Mucor saturninus]
MTHSSTSRSSSMDHEQTTPSNAERFILPPISSMDGFFASRSWPPPSTTIHTSLSSSTTSKNSYMDMASPISRTTNDPWSPIPNRPNDAQRLDYFTAGASGASASTTVPAVPNTGVTTTNTNSNSANSSYSSLSLSPMDRDDVRYQSPYENHYRQKSLPQISTFRKNSINSIVSQPSTSSTTTLAINNQQPSGFRYQPNNTVLSTSLPSNISQHTQPLEFVLTPSSLSTPSLRSIEKDIDQVIQHCNSLADNMNQKKSSMMDENYFSNPTSMRPWLDDMIGRANEVLNALLRLRKHQLAAEYAGVHRVSDQQHLQQHQQRRGAEVKKLIIKRKKKIVYKMTHFVNNWGDESWETSLSSSVNSVRLRKRGKRPVFQNRCHSCHISETPEWRRGPDGARTLCNACGLHYAKLAKKKVKQDVVKKEEDRDDT